MFGRNREKVVGAPDADLLNDLHAATKQQYKEDGTGCTPHGSADERREVLTERWAGTKITASIMEGGYASITQSGIYDDRLSYGERTGYLKRFTEAEGEIEEVSPAYGGYIALTNGACIALPNRGETRPAPMRNLGLEIEVVAA